MCILYIYIYGNTYDYIVVYDAHMRHRHTVTKLCVIVNQTIIERGTMVTYHPQDDNVTQLGSIGSCGNSNGLILNYWNSGF